MRSHQEFEARLFRKNKGLKQALEKKDIAFEIALMLIEARAFKNLTQAALAKLMKTKQPSIARVENGNYLPSLTFLLKVAKALGAELEIPSFRFPEVEEVRKEAVNTNAKESHGRQLDISFGYLTIPFNYYSAIRPNTAGSKSEDVERSINFLGTQVLA